MRQELAFENRLWCVKIFVLDKIWLDILSDYDPQSEGILLKSKMSRVDTRPCTCP